MVCGRPGDCLQWSCGVSVGVVCIYVHTRGVVDVYMFVCVCLWWLLTDTSDKAASREEGRSERSENNEHRR